MNQHTQSSATATPLYKTFRHTLHSSTIGQDFVVDVALPQQSTTEPLPAVYVTDGNWMFPMMVSTARLLMLGKEISPVLLIGIGYPDAQADDVLSLRTRDLTPSVDQQHVDRTNAGPSPMKAGVVPGGAEAFAHFIEQEVKPFIRANYAVTKDETLVGDSLGGLFGLYTLFNHTEFYNRYLLGSPSLWWDQRAMFATEESFATTAKDLDVDLFISVGDLEEDPSNADDVFKMVTNSHRLIMTLANRDYPSLRLHSHTFEGETHLSVIPATFSRGLRQLLAPKPKATPSQDDNKEDASTH